MTAYRIIYAVLAPVFRFIYRVRVIGRENIPEGPAVVCANHTSARDPIFLCIAFGSRPMRFMVKKELMKIPVLGAFLRSIGAIPVNRGAVDVSTIRSAIDALSGGDKVMIFPEGTRVRGDEDTSAAKTGAAMIACRAKVDMLPVYITNKQRCFKPVKVVIGKPQSTAGGDEKGSAKYKRIVENVFGDILRLGGENQI